MKTKYYMLKLTLLITLLIFTSDLAKAQERKWEDIDTTGYYGKQTIKRGKFTLEFISKDSALNEVTKQRMIEAFFKVYPQEVKNFNPKAARKVIFNVSQEYKGVAAAQGNIIKFDQEYIRKYPKDIDVVTHELMHVVQGYQYSNMTPSWIVEGIADFVRYKFGVDNPGAGWKLTEFNPGHSYTNSYRITARFLVWLENHGHKGLVKKLDANLRAQTYTDAIWQKETGKSLDEQWKTYAKNPTL